MCEIQTIRVNDEGTTIRGTIYDQDGAIANISSATTKVFNLRKPDKTWITRTATFTTDGTDGLLYYTLLAGDIDQAGRWEIHCYVELSSGKKYSTTNEFMAEEP